MSNISQSSISDILKDGIHVFKKMVKQEIVPPQCNKIVDVMAGFEEEHGLPGCVGAIHGTFFHVQQPKEWGDNYFCYKRMCATLVLAVCDSKMIFTYVSSGHPGSVGDAHVWNNCVYKQALMRGMFDAPVSATLPQLNINGQDIMSYVVADSAFSLNERVIKCYDVPTTQQEIELCNELRLRHALVRHLIQLSHVTAQGLDEFLGSIAAQCLVQLFLDVLPALGQLRIECFCHFLPTFIGLGHGALVVLHDGAY